MSKRRGRPRKTDATRYRQITISIPPEDYRQLEALRHRLSRGLPVAITRSALSRVVFGNLGRLDDQQILRRLNALKPAPSCLTRSLQGTVPSMSKRNTVETTIPPVPEAPFARGLHDPQRGKCYLFDDFRTDLGTYKLLLAIGRDERCDIHLDDDRISGVHAILERRGDVVWIQDHMSTNKIRIDETILREPVALRVGMRIQLGHSELIGAKGSGAFPFHDVYTISELCRKAAKDYGTDGLAAQHLGKSREYIRRHRTVKTRQSERTQTRQSEQ